MHITISTEGFSRGKLKQNLRPMLKFNTFSHLDLLVIINLECGNYNRHFSYGNYGQYPQNNGYYGYPAYNSYNGGYQNYQQRPYSSFF